MSLSVLKATSSRFITQLCNRFYRSPICVRNPSSKSYHLCMKLFMIRWPNGDTSFVGAPTKEEAFMFADCEWADPYDPSCEVHEVKRFAIDVVMADDGELKTQLQGFGGSDEFEPIIKAYPLLEAARQQWFEETTDALSPDPQLIPKAVIEEKRRLPKVQSAPRSAMEEMMGWSAGSPIAKLYRQ